MDETKEIFVKVASNEDYEKVRDIFNKYGVDCGYKKEQLILNDVWVDLDENEFDEFRQSIYNKVPNCLAVSTVNQWISVSDEEKNSVYIKFPNRKYEDDFDDVKIYTNEITNLKSFLKCLKTIEINIDSDSDTKTSIYRIWSEELNKIEKSKKVDFSLVLNNLKNMTIDNPITKGEISKNRKSIFRLCIIAENKETLEKIKLAIKKNMPKGDELVTKFNYELNNNMMYIIISDFYDDYYNPIEYFAEDLPNKTGKYLAVADSLILVPYSGDYVSEEGVAEYCFGNEINDISWDCMQYDEEFSDKNKDNINLNITDVVEFLKLYNFKLSQKEKEYIGSFIKNTID